MLYIVFSRRYFRTQLPSIVVFVWMFCEELESFVYPYDSTTVPLVLRLKTDPLNLVIAACNGTNIQLVNFFDCVDKLFMILY